MEQLTWHQRNAQRVAHGMRSLKAHICAPDYILTGNALCGQRKPKVYIYLHERHNPNNNVCKRCAAAANKQEANKP